MSPIKIKYIHHNSLLVGCVASRIDFTNQQLEYQLSFYKPNDHFDKDFARHLAIGRLIEDPIKIVCDCNNYVKVIYDDILFRSFSRQKFYPPKLISAIK
jgi:hypothetical protein